AAVIAQTPALQERVLTKTAGLIDALSTALQRRGVDDSSHIEPDPTRQLTGEQASAERPISRVQPAGAHPNADVAGAGRRDGRLLQAQHLRRLAVRMEAERPHGIATFSFIGHWPASAPRSLRQ
ncbi:MAG TPA: hypothetical protein VHS81_14095, partial [Caulobacteraceae bacterium]|nr:hypothetical protein [Caulobacteraceae bacterium]